MTNLQGAMNMRKIALLVCLAVAAPFAVAQVQIQGQGSVQIGGANQTGSWNSITNGVQSGSGSGQLNTLPGSLTLGGSGCGAGTYAKADGTGCGTPVASLTTSGTSGAATLTGDVLNIPNYSFSLNGLSGALNLTSSDSSVTITPSGTSINLEATGGGGGSGILPSDAYIWFTGDSVNGDDSYVLGPHIPVATWSCDGTTCTVTTTVPHGFTAGQVIFASPMTGWWASGVPGGNDWTDFFVSATGLTSTQFQFPYTHNTGSCASSCGFTLTAMNNLPYAVTTQPGMPAGMLAASGYRLFSGPNIQGVATDYATYLHPLSPAVTGKHGYLVIQDFNNDLYGTLGSCASSAAQILGFYAEAAVEAHADNWKVIIPNMIGRDQSNNPCSTIVPTVETVNLGIAAMGTPVTGTASTTATASSGATSVTVASPNGIMPGMVISGTGLQIGAQVTSAYTVGSTTVPLTLATTSALSSTAVTFNGGAYWDEFVDLNKIISLDDGASMIASNGAFGPAGASLAAKAIALALQTGGGQPMSQKKDFNNGGYWHLPASTTVNGEIWTDSSYNAILRIIPTYEAVQVEEPTWSNRAPLNVYSNNGSDIRSSGMLAGFAALFTPSGHGSANSIPIIVGGTTSGYSQAMLPNQYELGFNFDNSANDSAYLNVDRSSTDAFHATPSGQLCVGVGTLRNISGGTQIGCPDATALFQVGSTAQFKIAPTTGYPTVAGCAAGSYLKADGAGCGTPGGGSSPTIGFGTNAGQVSTDASPRVSSSRSGSITKCAVTVTASDATQALQFQIMQNGVDVFSSDPTVAAGSTSCANSACVIYYSLSSSSLSVAQGDVFQFNILQGSVNWKVTLQLE